MRRDWGLAIGVGLLASGMAAGGCAPPDDAVTSPSPDGGGVGAGNAGTVDAAGLDAAADVTSNSAVVSTGDGSVQDASTDAPLDGATTLGLGVPDSLDQVCDLHWPQTGARVLSHFLAAPAPAGGTYVAFSYGGTAIGTSPPATPPAFTLGTFTAAYATGAVIAHIDASCKLTWARAIGGASGSAVDGTLPTGLVADARGNVTVAGVFHGSVNLGGAANVSTVGLADFAGFLVRLDGSGQHTFDRLLQGTGSNGVSLHGLALTPDGVVSTLASGDGTPDFGGGATTPGVHFLRFDAQGALAVDRPLTGGRFLGDLTVAGDGTLYASQSVPLGDGGTEAYVVRWSSSTWVRASTPEVPSGTLAAGPTGVVNLQVNPTPAKQANVVLQGFGADGAIAWSHTTDLTPLGDATNAARILRVDVQGRPVVGGNLLGYVIGLPAGPYTNAAEPAGAGLLQFDAQGKLQRLQACGGRDGQLGDVALATDGTAFVLGYRTSASSVADVFVAKVRL